MTPNEESGKKTKKELFVAIDKLKNEVNSKREDLNKSNNEKELWHSRKADISESIRKKISAIKQDRNKRNALTKKVKELKEKRANFNAEIRKNIPEIDGLKGQYGNLAKKAKITDPIKIRGVIDSIESKLETEVMSFEAEKKLSKKLKLMKKTLADASGIMGIIDKIKKLNSGIRGAKRESNAVHREIQALAKESQEIHERVIAESKGIDDLKAKEEEAFGKFAHYKRIFNEKNRFLKENLSKMSGIRAEISKFQLEEDEKRKLHEATLIKTREQELEEKIKKGSKLTTEDFLVFQESIKGRK